MTRLLESNQLRLIKSGLKGIEKENLRVSTDGFIAQTPHPTVFGSALTHPYITTDYSEALLEFITPPFENSMDTLDFMTNIHQFIYDHLSSDELLLTSSMPCGIKGDDSIPIARYGSSNVGQMKHIYRRGLWHRYGRAMQAIAGVHFNYSVPETLTQALHQLEASPLTTEQYASDCYFGLIRNFLREGWLLLYLFGASPAICKSFLTGRERELAEGFDEFDPYTFYQPYATSLRMSDIGYKSKKQINLDINYNSLTNYVKTLTKGIELPYPDYEKIGVKVDGEYKQLNANLLQIENEFYSTIRPKQIAQSCEKPTIALLKRGVRYVEVRSLDLDVFQPTGISESTTLFLEAFLLYCFLSESPNSDNQEQAQNNANQLTVSHQGRRPELTLKKGSQEVTLQEWADDIFSNVKAICDILDQDNPKKPYTNAWQEQQNKIENPDSTPSAIILQKMQESNLTFSSFALKMSAKHEAYFRSKRLDSSQTEQFMSVSEESVAKQKKVEANDTLSFDAFLDCYFKQC